jgi:hypothetical protein
VPTVLIIDRMPKILDFLSEVRHSFRRRASIIEQAIIMHESARTDPEYEFATRQSRHGGRGSRQHLRMTKAQR